MTDVPRGRLAFNGAVRFPRHGPLSVPHGVAVPIDCFALLCFSHPTGITHGCQPGSHGHCTLPCQLQVFLGTLLM